MKPLRDLTGQRFGRLLVRERSLPNRRGNAMWNCVCDCGQERRIAGIQLTSGRTSSCGCLRLDRNIEAVTTHGLSKSRVYSIWHHMKRRCQDPANRNYARYGGRGITVCDRWQSFEAFLADMGQPGPALTLERRDNDGPYSPDNCVWADRRAQRRNTSTNIVVTLGRERLSLADACDQLGLKHQAVYMRMRRGATFDQAISENRERIAR